MNLLRRRASRLVSIPDLQIAGSTVSEWDSTTSTPAASSSNYPNNSGWVAIVYLPGISSLVGTVDATQLTINVSDPGYTTAGAVTTVNRTIKGVAYLRRRLPNNTAKNIGAKGSGIVVYVTLDDWIYSGTTIVSATVGATFYSGYAGSTPSTLRNSSDLAYTKPLFGWLNKQKESNLLTTSYAVEAVAAHRHAMNGKMVPYIEFIASDGTHTNTQTANSTAISSKISVANSQPPECYKATMDFTTLNDATQCTINAKVYPWIGDSTAVLDLSASGYSWPTSLPQIPLQVYNDKGGTYGGAYAYVDNVGGGTPQVSTTAATAAANPYASIPLAMAAIQTFNAGRALAHTDLGGGIIRLKEVGGANTTHAINAAMAQTGGSTWCTVEADPAATHVITITWTTQRASPTMMFWRNVTYTPNAQTYNILGPNSTPRSLVALDNVIFNNAAAKVFGGWFDIWYLTNITTTGTFDALQIDAPTSNVALMGGCVASGASIADIGMQAKVHVGCNYPANLNVIRCDQRSMGDGDHGRIIMNNKYYQVGLSNSVTPKTVSKGLALIQNLTEVAGADSQSFNVFNDSDLTTIDNFIEFYCSGMGKKGNHMYNDIVADATPTPYGLVKVGTARFNIWENYNTKTEAITSDAGAIGNFAWTYSVGNLGNISLFGDNGEQATAQPVNDKFVNFIMGNAWLPYSGSAPHGSNYNMQHASTTALSSATIMALFTSYTTFPQGSPAIGGDYRPKSTSTELKGYVPTGLAALAFDLAGAARLNNGDGSPGAYEHL